ncbi:MAG: ABC transporter ATP-binding protein, partial [Gemmataceae bacterium]
MNNKETSLPTSGTGPSSESPDAVSLRRVDFGYGRAPILRDVSLRLPPGQFLTLLGPSGCGKTTLLKLVGGYLHPSRGSVFLRGRDVTPLPPERRNVGMVFQHYALFPHMSARQNVAFPLEVRRVPRLEREHRIEAILNLVGLHPAERDRRPTSLSGGQQQRVALARAMVFAPDLLLLDEPLANLDRRLREQLQTELRRLQRETGIAAILVTHDQEEAMAVSDRIGVMSKGKILQEGPPDELYLRPRTPFVARALGEANLIPASLHHQGDRPLLIRPERCILGPQAEYCSWRREGRVKTVLFRGADVSMEVSCGDGLSLRVRARGLPDVQPGDCVWVGFPIEAAWLIPEHDRSE